MCVGIVAVFWRGARKNYAWALGKAGIGQLGGISSASVEQHCVPAKGTMEQCVSGRGASSRALCAEFLRPRRQLQYTGSYPEHINLLCHFVPDGKWTNTMYRNHIESEQHPGQLGSRRRRRR